MESLHLGKTITGEKQQRDAIHVAIAPTICRETSLRPGQHVTATGEAHGNPVGIVDPFLTRPVKMGEEFWLFLYPMSVTSLRHHWIHPAFEETV